MKTVHRMPLVAAAVAVLALAGCSSGGGNATATGSAGASTAAATPVTLTFQSLSDQPATIAATKKVVDSWNAANPDIQVQVVQASWDSINDKLTTQFAGGTAPDIIHDDAASIVSFAADGYLADLTSQMSQAKKDDIGKGLLASVTVDGKVIAYPTEVQSYMVFANKTLLDQAGVTIPTGDSMTWDQFRQIAKATTKNGVAGVGWGLKAPVATFMTLGLGSGGTYFDGTGTSATIHVGDGEMALPKLVHQMAYDDKSILPVTLTQSGSDALAAFYGGKVAMTVQGSYLAASMSKDAPAGFDWVVLPPLAGPDGPAQAADPQTLSVSADSKHVAQAVKFLEYFTSTNNLEAINEADALIPATTSAQQAMAAKLGSQNGWDQILKSGKDFQSAPFLFVDKYAQWKSTVATPAFQKYLANQIDDAGLVNALTSGWKQLG